MRVFEGAKKERFFCIIVILIPPFAGEESYIMKEHNYYVYILTNKNKGVLYIGVTNSLDQRLTEHNFAKSSSFTGKYNCHYLLYYEHFQYINRAIEREKQIKGWLRKKKEELINRRHNGLNYL